MAIPAAGIATSVATATELDGGHRVARPGQRERGRPAQPDHAEHRAGVGDPLELLRVAPYARRRRTVRSPRRRRSAQHLQRPAHRPDPGQDVLARRRCRSGSARPRWSSSEPGSSPSRRPATATGATAGRAAPVASGVGSAPSGNSSSASPIRARSPTEAVGDPQRRDVAGQLTVRGQPVVGVGEAAAETAKNVPEARNSQPIGFSGRRVPISAPTVAYGAANITKTTLSAIGGPARRSSCRWPAAGRRRPRAGARRRTRRRTRRAGNPA